MALSCFINPSKLAICSLKSSCSYTYRKNKNKKLVQMNVNTFPLWRQWPCLVGLLCILKHDTVAHSHSERLCSEYNHWMKMSVIKEVVRRGTIAYCFTNFIPVLRRKLEWKEKKNLNFTSSSTCLAVWSQVSEALGYIVLLSYKMMIISIS